MLNRIIIMGRLVSDPELKHTMSDLAVCNFTLAVDRDGKDKGTDFIKCVAWRKTAEFVKQYLTNGRQVVAEGRLQLRDWTDKDGGKRRSAEVNVDRVFFTADGQKAEPKPVAYEADMEPDPFAGLGEDLDDDLPF